MPGNADPAGPLLLSRSTRKCDKMRKLSYVLYTAELALVVIDTTPTTVRSTSAHRPAGDAEAAVSRLATLTAGRKRVLKERSQVK